MANPIELEEALLYVGIHWKKVDRKEQGEITLLWQSFYSSFWTVRAKRGQKALALYWSNDCREYYVGPIPGTNHGINNLYKCTGGLFADVELMTRFELVVLPIALDWTTIFHHEEMFFLRKSWSKLNECL